MVAEAGRISEFTNGSPVGLVDAGMGTPSRMHSKSNTDHDGTLIYIYICSAVYN